MNKDIEDLFKPYTHSQFVKDLQEEDKHLVWFDNGNEKGVEIEDPGGFKRLYPIIENTGEYWDRLAYQLSSKTWVTTNHMYKLFCIAMERLDV